MMATNTSNGHPIFEEIYGIEEAKEALKEYLVLPFRFPQLFTTRHPSRFQLLFGAPGVGKTSVVQSLMAHMPGVTLLRVHCKDLCSNSGGDGATPVHTLFERARHNQPSIVVIDNMETFHPKSQDSQIQIKTIKVYTREFVADGINP